MVRSAAEFSVGRKPQANAFLQLHRILDAAIFRRGQRRPVDRAARESRTRVKQRGRPQQASNVLGTERRMHAD